MISKIAKIAADKLQRGNYKILTDSVDISLEIKDIEHNLNYIELTISFDYNKTKMYNPDTHEWEEFYSHHDLDGEARGYIESEIEDWVAEKWEFPIYCKFI
jgi:sensor domain CHASE-containing protein